MPLAIVVSTTGNSMKLHEILEVQEDYDGFRCTEKRRFTFPHRLAFVGDVVKYEGLAYEISHINKEAGTVVLGYYVVTTPDRILPTWNADCPKFVVDRWYTAHRHHAYDMEFTPINDVQPGSPCKYKGESGWYYIGLDEGGDYLMTRLHAINDNEIEYTKDGNDIWPDVPAEFKVGDKVLVTGPSGAGSTHHIGKVWYVTQVDSQGYFIRSADDKHYHIPETLQPLTEDFKVGDKVRVLRKPLSNDLEDGLYWSPEMDKYVGQVGEVFGLTINSNIAVKFNDGEFWYFKPNQITKTGVTFEDCTVTTKIPDEFTTTVTTTVINPQGGKQAYVAADFDCIPPEGLKLLAECLAFGKNKYGKDNWKLLPREDNISHCLNHINEFRRGDTSEMHLVNAMARLTFALAQTVDSGEYGTDYVHPDMD